MIPTNEEMTRAYFNRARGVTRHKPRRRVAAQVWDNGRPTWVTGYLIRTEGGFTADRTYVIQLDDGSRVRTERIA
jgi:hypothetical protein